jgi:hypothetical protein
MPLLYALVARRTAVLAEYRCAFSDSTRGGVHMSHTVRGVYAPRVRWPRPLDSVCLSDTGSVFPWNDPTTSAGVQRDVWEREYGGSRHIGEAADDRQARGP